MTESGNAPTRRSLLSLALVAGTTAQASFASADPLEWETTPDLPAQREAMARLVAMSGTWRGPAQAHAQAYSSLYFSTRAERDMDGLLLFIRSSGYADSDRSDSPLVNALHIVSFNDASRAYEVRSYIDGRAATMEARLLDGHLQWRRPAGQAIERTTIAIRDGQWHEISDISRDGGATWTPLTEMRLARVARNAP